MNASFSPSNTLPQSSRSLLRVGSTALSALASAAVLVLAGCASTGAPQQSGMARYEQLQAQADGVRSYRAPEAANYRFAQIDPADVVLASGLELSTEQAAEVRGTLLASLADSLASAGLRTEGAGPRLRVRATVVGVEKVSPAVNAITTVLLWAPVSRGGLTVELEALDAATGQRIAAMAYEGKAGIKDVTRAYSSLGHASAEADRAAKRFAALIVQAPSQATAAGVASTATVSLATGQSGRPLAR